MWELTADKINHCLARSALFGDGRPIFEIWEAIAENQISDGAKLLWVKTVAESLVEAHRYQIPDDRKRVFYHPNGSRGPQDRVHLQHEALVFCGFTDPILDKPNPGDSLLLEFAITGHSREASELIWRLIDDGKASQFLIEHWNYHVARGVAAELKSPPADSKRRLDGILERVGLKGKKSESGFNGELVRVFIGVMRLLGPAAYGIERRNFRDTIAKKLKAAGLLPKDITRTDLARFKSDVIDVELKKAEPSVEKLKSRG